MTLNLETHIATGNRALREGRYEDAIRRYVDALQSTPALAQLLLANIEMAHRRHRAKAAVGHRLKVGIAGWELAHNAAGRVQTLASIYDSFATVEIVGCIFPSYGSDLWEPLRGAMPWPIHVIRVEDESRFLLQAIDLVMLHPYDVVHLSKPRLPNILIGALYKIIWDASVIVDVDDEELTFVGAKSDISVSSYLAESQSFPSMKELDSRDWTRLAVGLTRHFDGVTVSGRSLQTVYGGEIIRHARSERVFQPGKERRLSARAALGIAAGAKVVVFAGTPREHKGLIRVAELLAQLKDPNVVLLVVGPYKEFGLEDQLRSYEGIKCLFVDTTPFQRLPDVLAAADCCLLLSDEASPVVKYQTPAKLSDALAMGLHIFAVATPPLQEFALEEAITFLSPGNELSALREHFAGRGNRGSESAPRELFLREFSIAAVAPRLESYVRQLHAHRRTSCTDDLRVLLDRTLATAIETQPSSSCNTRNYLLTLRTLLQHGLQGTEVDGASAQVSDRSFASSSSQQSVDVVVPVFNALEDTQRCLSTLEQRNDGFALTVYVVNDGSDASTSAWLREFCSGRAGFQLVEHPKNLGYTHAVNSGLRLSRSPYVITLNSDTIVTHGWLRGLIRCVESDAKLGIVGPLSNAASWQNVPQLRDESGSFAINQLPQNVTADEFAQWVRACSRRLYPRLSFINGFCFLIRRAVIDAIGLLDQDTFPLGYGEENDYCMRASDAGYVLAVADDTYVFHAKSKSFGHERRTELSRKAGDLLRKKHGKDRFNRLLEQIGIEAKQLDAIREHVAEMVDSRAAPQTSPPQRMQRRSQLPRVATTDMHGTAVALLPPPIYGSKDYEVDPPLSGPCLLLPFDAPVPAAKPDAAVRNSIAVHLHLHYEDLLHEFIQYLKNIPCRYSLYVSVASASLVDSTATRLSAELPLAMVEVLCFPNRGRDIAPLVVGFGRKILNHEFVCHIHSKRSPHNRNKADWRRQLLVNLMGSTTLVSSILDCLRDNKHLGMIFPEYHHSLRGQISWGTNFPICEHLAQRLGLQIRRDELAIFPAGSMFWARVDAVSSLFRAGLTWDDFPEEASQVDGTLAHAVERLFGEVVVAAGHDLIQAKSEKQHSLFSYYPHRWPYKPSLSEDGLTQLTTTYRRDRASGGAKSGPRVVVYTALTGGYEQPVVHERLASDVEYVLYTDAAADDRGFWSVRPIPYQHERPVRRARHIKTNPHRYLSDFDIAVWIDANVVIRGDISRYIQLAIEHPDIPLFGIPHPHRDCLYDEARAVVAAKKDGDETVEPQISQYKREGYPTHYGLIETNLLVINLRHPQTAPVFAEWWKQIEIGSHRDQLSLNYALWKVGAKWMPIFSEKVTLRDSFDFAYLGHGRNSGYPVLKIGGARRVSVPT